MARSLLDSLAKRPTIILERPIVASLLERSRFQELEETEAFRVVKERWGRKLAVGVIDKIVTEMERRGYKVTPEMREAMVDAWASVVTRGLIG